jgi:2-polyprenyl-3-methyl-5-hydroxy-6-metoxy-1,4-benzoquinol methylase
MLKSVINKNDVLQRWETLADIYSSEFDSEGDYYRKVLLNPALFQLLGEVRGLKILDAGCGEGYLSRILAEKGASVTAFDFSERMLKIAKERTPSHLDIQYLRYDYERIGSKFKSQFDIVIANMVMQSIPDYDKAIFETYKVLKKKGKFIFSLNHPCFIIPNSKFDNNAHEKNMLPAINDYFEERVFELDFPKNTPNKVYVFHRTLSSYIASILKRKFSINAIIEPRPVMDLLKIDNILSNELKVPRFIVFSLKK